MQLVAIFSVSRGPCAASSGNGECCWLACSRAAHRKRVAFVRRAVLSALLLATGLAPAPQAAAADTQPPSVPTRLVGAAVSATQINLEWRRSTDNVGVKGYYVYLDDKPLATTTSRSFSHTGLTPGKTYYYRVSAFDSVPNHSAWTSVVAVKTPGGADTQAPTVPTGLVGTALSSSQINLSWKPSTDNVGVKGYYVYLNDAPLTTTTATSFSHTGRAAGTTYRYRVSAYDAVPNHSAWTATPIAVTTPAAPDTQAPSVPSELVGTAVSSSQINLSWKPSTDNVGVKGYYVYLNDAPLTTTTATSFSHTGRTPGTTYRYRVSAYDAVPNHSAWSATPVAVTTPAAPDTQAPSVPTGLVATAASSTQVNLSWNPSTDNVGVKGYHVYLDDQPLATTNPHNSYSHTGLTPGKTYNYRVSAYDAVPNHSAWTATVSVTTPGAPPPTPSPGQVLFSCTFLTAPTDCGFSVQQKVPGRATTASFGRNGGRAARLLTQPGDNNVAGSGANERTDLALSQQATDGYQGREHWWAHSILFPGDYVNPPMSTATAWHWGAVAGFHHTGSTGQGNLSILAFPDTAISPDRPTGLYFRNCGGATVKTDIKDCNTVKIGHVVKNVWYDFVYHVKWSSGSDGFIDAWVRVGNEPIARRVMSYRGPTLYTGMGNYLKLANYHTPFGLASAVIHDHIVRGTTPAAVSLTPLEGVN